MPRQARLDAAGTLHHVMTRGIERRSCHGGRCVLAGQAQSISAGPSKPREKTANAAGVGDAAHVREYAASGFGVGLPLHVLIIVKASKWDIFVQNTMKSATSHFGTLVGLVSMNRPQDV